MAGFRLLASSFATALLFSSPFTAAHPNKKKPDMPAQITDAKYVCVRSLEGSAYDAQVSADDRKAIADVEDALDAWGTYRVLQTCRQVDLVIVIHKAHTGPRAPIGTYPPPPKAQIPIRGPAPPVPGTAVEGGSPDDLLSACILHADGALSAPLWEKTAKDGLRAPALTLVREFREAVQAAIAARAKKNNPPAKSNP